MVIGLTPVNRVAAIRAAFDDVTTYYVALLTALGSAEDGSDIVEASGSSYARQGVTGWTPATVMLGPSTVVALQNTSDVVFAALSGALGPVVGFAIFDAPVAGVCLATGILLDPMSGMPAPVSFGTGEEPQFVAGTLTVGIAGYDPGS